MRQNENFDPHKELCLTRASSADDRVHRRRDDQGEQEREEQPSDDADGERAEKLGAGTKGQGEGEHAKHRRQ